MPEVLSATRPRPAINVFVLFPLQKKKIEKSETFKFSAFNLRSERSMANSVIIRTVEASSVQRNVYVLVDKSWSVALKNKDVRESGFWNVVFLESGLQLKESGIALAIGIRNPKLHWQNLESNTWNPGQKKRFKPVKATLLAACFSLPLIKTIFYPSWLMLDPPLDILSEYTFSLLEIITAYDHRVSLIHSFSDTVDSLLTDTSIRRTPL